MTIGLNPCQLLIYTCQPQKALEPAKTYPRKPTPTPYVVPEFAIHEELRNLVDAGLSPYDALKAGTNAAAEFLNAEEEFGTVTVGTRADLILLQENPLADVAKRAGVMTRGVNPMYAYGAAISCPVGGCFILR